MEIKLDTALIGLLAAGLIGLGAMQATQIQATKELDELPKQVSDIKESIVRLEEDKKNDDDKIRVIDQLNNLVQGLRVEVMNLKDKQKEIAEVLRSTHNPSFVAKQSYRINEPVVSAPPRLNFPGLEAKSALKKSPNIQQFSIPALQGIK